MIFSFQECIYIEVKKQFNMDLAKAEYAMTEFSVDSVETVEPFETIYKGDIFIVKNNDPVCCFNFTIESHENIPDQSICKLEMDEYWRDQLKIKSPSP